MKYLNVLATFLPLKKKFSMLNYPFICMAEQVFLPHRKTLGKAKMQLFL